MYGFSSVLSMSVEMNVNTIHATHLFNVIHNATHQISKDGKRSLSTLLNVWFLCMREREMLNCMQISNKHNLLSTKVRFVRLFVCSMAVAGRLNISKTQDFAMARLEGGCYLHSLFRLLANGNVPTENKWNGGTIHHHNYGNRQL